MSNILDSYLRQAKMGFLQKSFMRNAIRLKALWLLSKPSMET